MAFLLEEPNGVGLDDPETERKQQRTRRYSERREHIHCSVVRVLTRIDQSIDWAVSIDGNIDFLPVRLSVQALAEWIEATLFEAVHVCTRLVVPYVICWVFVPFSRIVVEDRDVDWHTFVRPVFGATNTSGRKGTE